MICLRPSGVRDFIYWCEPFQIDGLTIQPAPLQQALLEQVPLGKVEVGRQAERAPRLSILSLRYLNVPILPPHRGVHRIGAQPISVWVIWAQAESIPEGEEPIDWWLLTTMPVLNLDQAKRCVQWYIFRWLIERYHFVLKSGCRVERLQLENTKRIKRALALYSIVADLLSAPFPSTKL